MSERTIAESDNIRVTCDSTGAYTLTIAGKQYSPLLADEVIERLVKKVEENSA